MSHSDHDPSRRAVLAAGGSIAVASLAGCSSVVEYVSGRALGDVNVVNGAGDPISGTITITDPGDEDVLVESFDLDGAADDGEVDVDADSVTRYDDVWTEAGEYAIGIDLDEGELDDADADVDADDVATVANDAETVTIDDPDAEQLAIGIAQEGPAGLVSYHVVDGVGDLVDEFE